MGTQGCRRHYSRGFEDHTGVFITCDITLTLADIVHVD
jgi:hypothetical protein